MFLKKEISEINKIKKERILKKLLLNFSSFSSAFRAEVFIGF